VHHRLVASVDGASDESRTNRHSVDCVGRLRRHAKYTEAERIAVAQCFAKRINRARNPTH
jgi:hypothetical protein